MRNILHSTLLAVAFLLSPLLTGNAQACSCREYESPPCAAYWRASAVFVGQVLEITPPTNNRADSLPYATLRFSVEEAFRGVTAGTPVDVLTLSGTSCDMTFNTGERYLIYGHRGRTDNHLYAAPCDRTRTLSRAGEDMAYIRSLSTGTAKQSLIGRVSVGQYDELKDIRVVVEGNAQKYELTTDAEGRYKVDLTQPGTYKVRAFLPFSAMAEDSQRFKSEPTEQQTVIEYEVPLAAGHCDYREMHIFKIDLRATAEVGGRVVDMFGKAAPDLTLYLYPATERGGVSGDNYKFATTDKEGSYRFNLLRAGRYLLGVNIKTMPDVSAPYPTTFYPGVPTVEQATVITVGEGQKIEKRDIQLPPELVEREVTGVLM